MKFKDKYYIVFPYHFTNEIKWPEKWGNTCPGNVSSMLQEELNVSTIGSEIKWIINDRHRYEMLKDYDLSNEDLNDYMKSNCTMVSFSANGTMKRAEKALKRMGGESFVCVDSYKKMLLQQIFYKRNAKFSEEI